MITRSTCCVSMISSRSSKRPSQGRSGVPTSWTSSSTIPIGTRPYWAFLPSFSTTCPATIAGAEDQGPLAQALVAVQAGADDGAGDAAEDGEAGDGEEGEDDRVLDRGRGGEAEQRPGDQQDGDEAARHLGNRRGPDRQLVAAVEADAEGGERPERGRTEDESEALVRSGGRARSRRRRRRTRPRRSRR